SLTRAGPTGRRPPTGYCSTSPNDAVPRSPVSSMEPRLNTPARHGEVEARRAKAEIAPKGTDDTREAPTLTWRRNDPLPLNGTTGRKPDHKETSGENRSGWKRKRRRRSSGNLGAGRPSGHATRPRRRRCLRR